MKESEKPQTLEALLAQSRAHEVFKEAVLQLESGETSDHIRFNNGNPLVKVLRVIKYFLATHRDLPVEAVAIDARSGCSDYKGTLTVEPGKRSFTFEWDCYWKACELGWKNFFGNPDQTRAARTFDYLCFRKFEEISSPD